MRLGFLVFCDVYKKFPLALRLGCGKSPNIALLYQGMIKNQHHSENFTMISS